MLPSQALLLLCHLDNDLVTIITYNVLRTDCSYLPLPTSYGDICSLTVPQCGPGP